MSKPLIDRLGGRVGRLLAPGESMASAVRVSAVSGDDAMAAAGTAAGVFGLSTVLGGPVLPGALGLWLAGSLLGLLLGRRRARRSGLATGLGATPVAVLTDRRLIVTNRRAGRAAAEVPMGDLAVSADNSASHVLVARRGFPTLRLKVRGAGERDRLVSAAAGVGAFRSGPPGDLSWHL